MSKEFTHLERMLAEFNFERPDRVPVFLNNAAATSRAIGVKVGQMLVNADIFSDALCTSFEKYQYDGIRINADVAVETEAMGAKAVYQEDGPCAIKDHPVKTEADFDKLRVPDPYTDGRMPIMLKTTSLTRKRAGDDVYIASSCMGPMNIASQMLGVDNLMVMCIDDPDFLNRILDFTTQITINYGKALYEAGATCITMGEAVCSEKAIGPNFYREFAAPHHKIVIDEFNSLGIKYHTFHICGPVKNILLDIADTGVASLDIDAPVDIAESRKMLGNRLCMLGNVAPSELLKSSPERITELAKKVLENKEGLGIVLGAGCNMAPDTPEANIRAMVQAAKDFGRYE